MEVDSLLKPVLLKIRLVLVYKPRELMKLCLSHYALCLLLTMLYYMMLP
ncbi:hypothetical protein PL2TA16_02929 [Pseudoalteromonas luteoviolacea 2ta16]|uniref:Uncharacterized protein n=1 Tax=Pseudoalteromonas luteoviolacea (strain 2ta16) TaxID=1353533 RepID=V4HSB1_PSEL2|nr:hypothetical protein PL2TA16_02929 [Pseudoalteromonas luteoviolacea 2ta16]